LLPSRRCSWLVYVFMHRKFFVFYATNPSVARRHRARHAPSPPELARTASTPPYTSPVPCTPRPRAARARRHHARPAPASAELTGTAPAPLRSGRERRPKLTCHAPRAATSSPAPHRPLHELARLARARPVPSCACPGGNGMTDHFFSFFYCLIELTKGPMSMSAGGPSVHVT
jgi:hypothetical protein